MFVPAYAEIHYVIRLPSNTLSARKRAGTLKIRTDLGPCRRRPAGTL